jgi:hypothetical protein
MAVTDGNVHQVLVYRRCRGWRGSQILEGLEGHFLRLLETILLLLLAAMGEQGMLLPRA